MLCKHQLKKIVSSLKEGQIIAFPTETVYALAGDARNLSTIKRIFKLKNRPLNQPLSVLLPENPKLETWADDVSPMGQRLASYFWPGPLTLILNKKPSVFMELTGGQAKIGLRVPDHAIAQSLLKAFAGGLAAPSANRSSHFSPTQAIHVQEEFGEQLEVIVDGGACPIGVESTIVDVSAMTPKILRLGAISQREIENIINCEIILDLQVSTSHIGLACQQITPVGLQEVVYNYLNQGKSVTVLARHSVTMTHENLFWITMPSDANLYGQVLYKHLREAEQNSTDKILIEAVPASESWSGIQTVLEKYTARI